MHCHFHNRTGFTLVELAVSLMIMGLLIGGVLKGIELTENARYTQVIRQVKGYESATFSFQSIYNALPGDIRNPSTRVPNCTTAPCSSTGNKNGLIGVDSHSVAVPGMFFLNIARGAVEDRNYWIHLQKAGLINAINPDLPLTGTFSGEFGQEFPNSAISTAGFLIQSYFSSTYGMPVSRGHYLQLRGNADYSYALSSKAALFIDKKVDDGLPTSGDIRPLGSSGSLVSLSSDCASATEYAINSDGEKTCNLLFSIQ